MGLEQGVASCDGSCPRASEHTKHQHPAHLTAHLARSLMPSLSLVPAYDSARARARAQDRAPFAVLAPALARTVVSAGVQAGWPALDATGGTAQHADN